VKQRPLIFILICILGVLAVAIVLGVRGEKSLSTLELPDSVREKLSKASESTDEAKKAEEKGEGKKEPASAGAPSEKPGPPSSEADRKKQAPPGEKPEEKKPSAESQPEKPPEEEKFNLTLGANTPVMNVLNFIHQKTKKPVLLDAAVMQKKITIINKEKVTLKEALRLIEGALEMVGVVLIDEGDRITAIPIENAKKMGVRIVPPSEALEKISAGEIASVPLTLKYQKPSTMKEILKDLVEPHTNIIADDRTNTLIITDTGRNIERYKRIIALLDVEEAMRNIIKIFKLRYSDARELSELLKNIVVEEAKLKKERAEDKAKAPVILIMPDAKNNAVIVSAPVEELQTITSLINDLDKEEVAGVKTEILRLKYIPADDLAKKITALYADVKREEDRPILLSDKRAGLLILKGTARIREEVKKLVGILDVEEAEGAVSEIVQIKYLKADELAAKIGQLYQNVEQKERPILIPDRELGILIVKGTGRLREEVKGIVKSLDVKEADIREVRVFTLKHAEPEEVAEEITKTLIEPLQPRFRYPWDYYYRRRGREQPAPITVIPNARLHAVTVKAPPSMMKEVEEIVLRLDVEPEPLEVARPRLYPLEHADAYDVYLLMNELFEAEEELPSYFSFFGPPRRTKKREIGRLYGQVKFSYDEHSNSLIVITNSAANFEIIEEMIKVLDVPVPKYSNTFVIELEHADAEELSFDLNMIFARGGAGAPSARPAPAGARARETPRSSEGDTSERRGRTREEERRARDTSAYTWLRAKEGLTPISTLIGKVRIVPDKRSNALIITCEPSHEEAVRELIESLDQPRLQVLIEAVIAEVTYEGTTNLGVRFSADLTEAITGTAADETIRGVVGTDVDREYGKGTVLTAGVDIAVIIQYLQRKANVKVKSSPSVFTADNQPADFFEGSDVPFTTRSSTSPEGTIAASVDYRPVGTLLSVTPHIILVKEGDSEERLVDLDVTLEIASVVPGETAFGAFVLDRRETNTHLVVRDRQTMVISGIMRQEEFEIIRKVPILGDIPLLNLIFKKKDKTESTTELIAFITPKVLATPEEMQSEKDAKEERLHKYSKWKEELDNREDKLKRKSGNKEEKDTGKR